MPGVFLTKLIRRTPLRVEDAMGPLFGVQHQMSIVRSRLGIGGARMTIDILGMGEAAERLGITTREMVQLVYDRRIRFVIVDGIPRIPEDALDDYRPRAS